MIGSGAVYPIAFDVLDATGTLTHADTASLVITLPDGTTASPAITDDAVPGQYRLAYQTTMAGRHTLHAETTGPVTAYDDEFDVSPTPWMAIVSLADAKQHLRMDPADTSEDDELRGFVAAATGAVELYKHEVIARRSITDEIDLCRAGYRGARRFRVWSAPVISLVSVASWDGATTWDVTQMRVSESGLVRVMGALPVRGLVDVTYLAGYQVIPDHYRQGALVVLQHAWESQRGGGTVSSGVIGPEEVRVRSVSAFTVPNKAKEYLGPPRPVVA